jgi:hypothetical protein
MQHMHKIVVLLCHVLIFKLELLQPSLNNLVFYISSYNTHMDDMFQSKLPHHQVTYTIP